MTIYCIDDGGDGSQTNTTQTSTTLDWSKADTSLVNLLAYDANALTTDGNIIYFGNDTIDQNTYSANHTYTGSSNAGERVLLVSADRTQSTPTYLASTTRQIDTSNNGAAAYTLSFVGQFFFYGMSMKSGGNLVTGAGSANGGFIASENCRFALGANANIRLAGNVSWGEHKNVTIDLTADGTTARTGYVVTNATDKFLTIYGLSFVNAGYRTGSVFGQFPYILNVSGADFSGFTNGTTCEIAYFTGGKHTLSNCLTAATWSPSIGLEAAGSEIIFSNCGPADAPTYLYCGELHGNLISSNAIYRTGGATIEGDSCAWLVTTNTYCNEACIFYTPWIYDTVASTGSKTFSIYITNNSADFTDAEVWMELEYLKDADEAQWTLASDQRSTITTTPVAQTDDTSSTWNGGGLFTYKQKLSVTATIGETGQYRARVCVGKASIDSSAYFYIDPKVFIT